MLKCNLIKTNNIKIDVTGTVQFYKFKSVISHVFISQTDV